MADEKLLNKLHWQKCNRHLILNRPGELKSLFEGLTYDTQPQSEYDFILIFAAQQKLLDEFVSEALKYWQNDKLFWISYPKLSGKINSDIKRETVWNAFDLARLKPVAQVAVNKDWSALRARPKEREG